MHRLSRSAAVFVLCALLADTNEAPLKRAILKSGLGEDVDLSMENYEEQARLVLTVRNTEADKAQVTSLGELMVALASRTPVGSQVPDLTVPGTLHRKPGLFRKGVKEGDFKLRKLKGNPGYLVFYTASCQACQELLAAVDDIVAKDRKAKVLLIDMDTLFNDQPDKANELLDNFDLSVLPFVLQLDRKGTVRHRYVQLL